MVDHQIFGCVLIAVGSYAVTNEIGALSGATLPTGITVLGVFILLLSLLGALAAYKEARIFLIIYFVVLLLLTLILFFVGIAVYVERDNVDSLISQGWQASNPDLKRNLQEIFDCCGCCTDDYQQWTMAGPPVWNCSSTKNQGCLPVFKDYLASYYVTAGGCGIAFAVFMFLGMILVCFLMDGIKKKRAEQDLAKLRASNNTEDADLQLTAQDRRQIAQDELDEDDEEDMDDDDDEEAAPMRR